VIVHSAQASDFEIHSFLETKRRLDSREQLPFQSTAGPSFDILLLSVPAGTIAHAAMIPMTLLYSREPNESAIRNNEVDDLYLFAIHTYNTVEARRAASTTLSWVTDNRDHATLNDEG